MQSTSVRRTRASSSNPVEAIEEIIADKEWVYDRRCDTEIAIEAPGTWCDYGMFFAWSEDLSALHFSCALDMRVQPKLMGQIYELIAKLNERLWLGHFAVWVEEGIPMFRHTLRLRDQIDVDAIGDLMDLAVSECERYYPAFQFVIWGGRTAEDAITSSLLDTVGQA
ncbi:MAG: YbjN domain-containing protein [Rhodobacteraceae bacterium]|nr:YbjN domain-containing protein [Paracoccaceae bacterium]